MIARILNYLRDRNPFAEYRLRRASGGQGRFVCRGRFQLTLDPSATVTPSSAVTSIGIPLFGPATLRSAVTVLTVQAQAKLFLDGAIIGRGASLNVLPGAELIIGRESYIADGSKISASKSIRIGRRCAISWGVTIIDDDGHGFGNPPYTAQIVIEDEVWVGCNVTILKGVTLGAGSVVAAGAVVTQSCKPHSLIGGVPARLLRENVHWTDASRLNDKHVAFDPTDAAQQQACPAPSDPS